MANLSQYYKMRFVQFLHLDRGSNTVGFALVAPLLIGSFLAVSQIANAVNVQTVLNAAAKSGARQASRYDAALIDGQATSLKILSSHGIHQIDQLNVVRKKLDGVTVIEVSLSKNYRIPWLGFEFPLTASGISIDEKYL